MNHPGTSDKSGDDGEFIAVGRWCYFSCPLIPYAQDLTGAVPSNVSFCKSHILSGWVSPPPSLTFIIYYPHASLFSFKKYALQY